MGMSGGGGYSKVNRGGVRLGSLSKKDVIG